MRSEAIIGLFWVSGIKVARRVMARSEAIRCMIVVAWPTGVLMNQASGGRLQGYMLMKSFGIFASCAAAALLVSSPAAATTVVSNSYPAASFAGDSGNFSLGAGTYLFSLSFTQPVTDVLGWVGKTTVSNFYCDEGAGEFYCGGDDVPTQPLFEMVNPALYQLYLTVNDPSTINYPPGSITVREEDFDTCCDYQFDFTSGAAGIYTLSYAAVPEPQTWMMFVLGFGAIGAVARRRRTVVARPALATS
jgi:hypothetical protein